MADVTALRERVVISHHGQLKYDGGLNELSRRIAPVKLIEVVLAENGRDGEPDLSRYGTPVKNPHGGFGSEDNDGKRRLQAPAAEVATVTARLLSELPVRDLTIEAPSIEAVIERVFQDKAVLRTYQRLEQVNWAEQGQYRANLLMYLMYWLVAPIVNLAVWTTMARGQGAVNGLTTNDFVTYYRTLLVVDTGTSEITIYLLAYRIQGGTLASELLKPIHPILTNILINNLAFKTLPLMALAPIWIGLSLLFGPDYGAVTLGGLLLAPPALMLGFAITFLAPVAVATTVPLQALRGDLAGWQVSACLGVGAASVVVALRVWRAGISGLA